MLAGCTQLQVFEKNTPIPNYEWKTGFSAAGSFDIKDTTSSYNIYIVIRHTDAYKYNNIWLNIGFNAPGDVVFNEKREIELGTDAGGWMGTGMNDIWEVRKLLNAFPRRFKKPGTYNFNIQHIMRTILCCILWP
ncbi:MAG: gliding motility lipoprotein GldH [Chitinophagaceae bacterium]|nr:gliding motility lipoprotein GldH [Chitinophagaceae bacterium]